MFLSTSQSFSRVTIPVIRWPTRETDIFGGYTYSLMVVWSMSMYNTLYIHEKKIAATEVVSTHQPFHNSNAESTFILPQHDPWCRVQMTNGEGNEVRSEGEEAKKIPVEGRVGLYSGTCLVWIMPTRKCTWGKKHHHPKSIRLLESVATFCANGFGRNLNTDTKKEKASNPRCHGEQVHMGACLGFCQFRRLLCKQVVWNTKKSPLYIPLCRFSGIAVEVVLSVSDEVIWAESVYPHQGHKWGAAH